MESKNSIGNVDKPSQNTSKRLKYIGKHMSIDSSIHMDSDTVIRKMDESYQPKLLRQVSGSGNILSDYEIEHKPINKVLVLYTGGTIGMKSMCGGDSYQFIITITYFLYYNQSFLKLCFVR